MCNDISLFIHDNRARIELSEENGWPIPEDAVAYGEGWEGMAEHVHDMSALDRIIFEECEPSETKVMAPHLNLKAYPHWLCPEYIAPRIGCDLHEAANLLDCWVMLDPTQQMVETFIAWTKARGVESSLRYFEKLALALAEVENIDVDDATETEDVDYAAPDLYRYHVLGEDESKAETPWIECQPKWYRTLIDQVRNCTDLDALAALGKAVYDRQLTHGQAGVFWTEYNLRKSALEKAVRPGPVARVFIEKIARANGNLASLGAWLYKVQQGRIAVRNVPRKHEWTVIWKAYQRRKQEHGPGHPVHGQASLF
jgi:hypothetical protein